MSTTCIVLAMMLFSGVQLQTPSAQDQKAAEKELRKRGVKFNAVSLYASFIEDFKTREEAEEFCKGNVHIVINDSKKLKREDLTFLRDLPNLKEVVVGPDFPDDWCKDLEPLTQLEGLFFRGLWAQQKGLTDRGLAPVAKLNNLQALSLLDTRVTDDGLRHIKGLTKLRWLSLRYARNITNAGLVHLKDLKNLEDLSLEATKTTAAGLVHLQGLTKLRRVRLANEMQQQAAAVGLRYIAKMTELRRLDARGLCAGDDDLKAVRKMTKLKELNLCYTKVTDKGLEHLAGLTELEELDLFGTGVTGDGLKHLRGLKNLRTLVLGFCPLKDNAAEHLRHMTHLKYLEITTTKMRKKTIDELKRLLPKTTIQ
jgi:Leucine-rich repeat (LRR) protein